MSDNPCVLAKELSSSVVSSIYMACITHTAVAGHSLGIVGCTAAAIDQFVHVL